MKLAFADIATSVKDLEVPGLDDSRGGTYHAETAAPDGAGTVWADAQTVLALFGIDPPGLGGVSLRSRAGPARDRWLALLRGAVPASGPIRRLPLNTRDDRLLGGLDLAATLRSGRPVEQKGLLAESDGGVVLLVMAERIDLATAARLGNVMDLGVVSLQRDGLSSSRPARFGVVALDEGIASDERPPATLLDRLAFHLDLDANMPRELGPPAWDLSGLDAARGKLASITVRDGDIRALCGTALALGIDSIRAPLLALRAARAAAALAGRDTLADEDLVLASRLVLIPRALRLPPADEPEPRENKEPSESKADHSPDSETPGDRPLEDVVLEAARAALPPDLLARLARVSAGSARARTSGRVGQLQASLHRGRPIGVRQGVPRGGARLHVPETLKAAAPWQKLRARAESGGMRRIEIRPDDFRVIRFRQRTETTTIFAVDASGSAALNRLGEAKGAVELLLADCYVRRDQVALIAFRGRDATLLLSPTNSLVRAKRCLAGLPGGGATPLAAGIDAAVALAEAERRRGRTPVIVLLTDGRANIGRDGSGGRPVAEAEAMSSAGAARLAGFTVLVVDTSPRPNPFAHRLAEAMGARYVPLPQADATALSRAVRAAAVA